MTDILFQGWQPNPQKICARCGGDVECAVYQLCDDCHQEDTDVADLFDLAEQQQLEVDARSIVECARYTL